MPDTRGKRDCQGVFILTNENPDDTESKDEDASSSDNTGSNAH